MTKNEIDIWRDTNEEKLRKEWISIASNASISVRGEMDQWKPRTRDSAKRMKQSILQIRLDIGRTWNSHSAYSTEEGRKCLERVLVSWVAHNPRIGYCQSMNFIGAMILAVCKGDEDETISIFSCLMENTSFGDYFHREKHFEALHQDTEELEIQLLKQDEKLALHFKSIHFELSSISPNWLLTCFFLQNGPIQSIQILDTVLKCGKTARTFLIDHAIENLIKEREELLKCIDMESVFCKLKEIRDS